VRWEDQCLSSFLHQGNTLGCAFEMLGTQGSDCYLPPVCAVPILPDPHASLNLPTLCPGLPRPSIHPILPPPPPLDHLPRVLWPQQAGPHSLSVHLCEVGPGSCPTSLAGTCALGSHPSKCGSVPIAPGLAWETSSPLPCPLRKLLLVLTGHCQWTGCFVLPQPGKGPASG
jgi:hypothetical protein